jgi:hypothetical protein
MSLIRLGVGARFVALAVVATITASLLFAAITTDRASAAGPVTIVSDMVTRSTGPTLILDADEGIPVTVRGRVLWLYFYNCYPTNQSDVVQCYFSVYGSRGQDSRNLLGGIFVWMRWNGYTWVPIAARIAR